MTTSVLEAAREIYRDELRHDRRSSSPTVVDLDDRPDYTYEVCPVSWILPGLLELVAECHNEPASHLRSAIRQLLMERAFAFQTGMAPKEQAAWLDHETDVLIRVLERIRQQRLECGDWSDLPACQEMFG